MHDHAEHGVAAHWAYKEAGTKGYAGVTARANTTPRSRCCASCWPGSATCPVRQDKGLFDDRIYVLTPDAAVVELPKGATPVDFAYTVHTNLGHRCRGARVDGAMVPLNTPLQNGQTVEITTVRGRRPVARLAERRAGLSRQPPGPRQGARLVQRPGPARDRGPRP
jgi:GTP pyrophosphokinase